MSDPGSDIADRLSKALKQARAAQGLSLDAVARLSGVSRSMVSQIERGQSSPTVATLWNLTQALKVDFAGLLDAPQTPDITFLAAGQVPVIEGQGKDCVIRILSPTVDAGTLEVYDLTFGPDGRLDSQAHGSGAREHLTVTEGVLTVQSGASEQVVGPGDTALYPVDRPHALIAGAVGARAVLIVRHL